MPAVAVTVTFMLISLCISGCMFFLSLCKAVKVKNNAHTTFVLYQMSVLVFILFKLLSIQDSTNILQIICWMCIFSLFYCYHMFRLQLYVKNSVFQYAKRNIIIYMVIVTIIASLWIVMYYVPKSVRNYISIIIFSCIIIFIFTLIRKFYIFSKYFKLKTIDHYETIKYTLNQRKLMVGGYIRNCDIFIPDSIKSLIYTNYLESFGYDMITKKKQTATFMNRQTEKFLTYILKFVFLWLLANVSFIICVALFWINNMNDFEIINNDNVDICLFLGLVITTFCMLLQWNYVSTWYETKFCCCISRYIDAWILQIFDEEESAMGIRLERTSLTYSVDNV